MLTCDNLTFRAGPHIIAGLGFTLQPGAILHVQGINGCGKTTLLKTIAGLYPLDAGSISWNKETGPLYQHAPLSYIGHELGLKKELTVWQNLLFNAELYGSPELALAAIGFFGLEHFIDTPCYRLSAGWKKKTALARLLACPSDLWLLDEPDTNLDKETREKLEQLIHMRADQGGIIMCISHQLTPHPFSKTLSLEDFYDDTD